MNESAARELASRGLGTEDFTATWLRDPQMAWADLLITATAGHKAQVLELEPRGLRRTFTLRELARLAGHVPAAELPPGTPGARLRALAAAAADLRGVHPPSTRTADDIEDPFGGTPQLFRATADEIDAAAAAIIDAL
jgi:protein-tyrosine phosphatase